MEVVILPYSLTLSQGIPRRADCSMIRLDFEAEPAIDAAAFGRQWRAYLALLSRRTVPFYLVRARDRKLGLYAGLPSRRCRRFEARSRSVGFLRGGIPRGQVTDGGTRLYKVTYSELTEAGFDIGSIDPRL